MLTQSVVPIFFFAVRSLGKFRIKIKQQDGMHDAEKGDSNQYWEDCDREE